MLPNVSAGTGTRTQVLCVISDCSSLLSYISNLAGEWMSKQLKVEEPRDLPSFLEEKAAIAGWVDNPAHIGRFFSWGSTGLKGLT